jgi:hypothetical protein
MIPKEIQENNLALGYFKKAITAQILIGTSLLCNHQKFHPFKHFEA